MATNNHDDDSIFSLAPEEENSTSIFDSVAAAEGDLTNTPAPTELQTDNDLLEPHIVQRRADIAAKQEILAKLLEELECESLVLLMPAHVAWFTSGMNVRGLIADGERPGIYTNGRQRFLLASNIDAQRLFDEELNGLGFQLKEWQWSIGRATLLSELVAGKKFAADRPFPNTPLINERLRLEIRSLTNYEQAAYLKLGQTIVHALEATGRNIQQGDTECEIAGQLAHRLYRHGVEATSISVATDERTRKVRRAGFTEAKLKNFCVLQVTGYHHGLYATASRTVCFDMPLEEVRMEYDMATKMSAIYRSYSIPEQTVGAVADTARRMIVGATHEYEWRYSQPGYGTGRYAAEELRKAGHDEPFAPGWPLVWQAKIGSASIVDTVLVDQHASQPITPTESWPFKRIKMRERFIDVPDILIRE